MKNGQWGKLTRSAKERRLLEGPQGRLTDLWRAVRVFGELVKGFREFHFLGPCVTVFGSARFSEDHRYYEMGRAVGSLLAERGYTVMTGGGPGIMEAANRGSRDRGGYSVGCNIRLPKEQHPNPYLDKWVEFDHFFVRKLLLMKYSYAFIALPGGFGTLDEIYETATLIQTGKIRNFPLVLMGKDFWEPLLTFTRERLLREKTIEEKDAALFFVTDSPQEAVEHVYKITTSAFGLRIAEQPKPRWWLFEHK
jgi:uncharacterized protein (TIGR00730 family)